MRTVLLGLALGVSSGGATTMFMNPLIPSDAPDPGCLVVDTKYICTHTFENDAGVFPIYSSSDMVEWTYEGPALDYYTSNITSWAIDDHWAPEIHPSPANDGTYLLYHTALTKDNKLCLGVAHSDSATGPFSDSHELLCNNDAAQVAKGIGFIDCTLFVNQTTGTPYLVWKIDGNAGGEHTPIMAAELTADGMALVNGAETDRIELIRNDLSWESICTEGPWIVSRGEYLYLFYSGNMYDTVHYSVGVARATSIYGPWEKKGDPILTVGDNSSGFSGPGHCSVIEPINDAGSNADGDYPSEYAMVYHAHVGYDGSSARNMLLDTMVFGNDGWPYMRDGTHPTETTEAVPVY